MSIGSGMERSMDGDDAARFVLGQKVDARYRGGKKYFSGTIRKVSGTGTLLVLADGPTKRRLPARILLRIAYH
jgi:hypothetical protein